uniref:NUAK family SNF1-like kinase 1 n=1 Tax=Lygus hesperus TaxID=30085 RepID=A0A146M0I2_LYGHE
MVVPESINNIMGGLESTGGVTLHNHRRKLKQRFETIAKLGQGTYGKVQLGVNKETGQEVAIKTIKKCKIETEADLIRIRREIQIMSSLRHPYIIHIYEVFENRDKMVLVMEYAAGGELYDYLSKQKVLEESEARRIFRQIAMAVYYCHKHQICHRDLKLENILLDEQGNAKIADFGLSNVFDSNRLLSTFCGSPLYASPEIVKGIPYHGPEVDCWSLGVLLYTLVYGAMPFDGSNFKRLVRQISAGEYFEPKVPSSASDLIRGLLTVKGTERLDIAGVCQHIWMNEEGKVSCHRLAVELAQEEPNRLDLLLALAPPPEQQIPSVPEEGAAVPTAPVRSQSLSSLSTVQPSATFTTMPSVPAPSPQVEKKTKEENERKRERSSSRSRRKDSDEDKPKRKSVKSKKKSDSELPPKEEVEKVLELAAKVSDDLSTTESTPSSCAEPISYELPKEPAPSPKTSKAESSSKVDRSNKALPVEPSKSKSQSTSSEEKSVPKEKKEKKLKKKEPKEEPSESSFSAPTSSISTPSPSSASRKDISAGKEEKKKKTPKDDSKKEPVASAQVPQNEPRIAQEQETPTKPRPPPVAIPPSSDVPSPQKPSSPVTKVPDDQKEQPLLRQDSVRRKSKVFEAAELFSKSPTQDKLAQKKVFIPGVKVSDARAAFERKSSIPQSPPAEKKPEVSLASTVNLNKLVMSEMSKEKPVAAETAEVPPSTEEVKEKVVEKVDEKLKKENAIKVITHAISESELNEKKASTLPRRKSSRPTVAAARPTEPEHMVANTRVSQVVYPTVPPVPPPRPSLTKQDSGPREHIIPIQIEGRDDPPRERFERAQSEKPSNISSRQTSISSKASSSSLGRQDSDCSNVSMSTITTSEPIRKSPREVIIPIAVEGGGYVTPSQTTLNKMSSVSESEEDLPMRGFGLHSTRRRLPQLETADSISSDEDDGDFEAISTENLFSTLLARMRNLTQRLDEGRPTFPRLFNPMFEPRRLMETKSFDQDPTPWRRKSGMMPSTSSTLPRGFTTKSLRRYLSREEPKTDLRGELPPAPRRKVTRTTSDSVQNGTPLPKEPERAEPPRAESILDDLLNDGNLSSLDRVKKYLEDLQKEDLSYAGLRAPEVSLRPKSPINRSQSVNDQSHSRYLRPRSVYVPGSQGSEFDKYINFKKSLEQDRYSGLTQRRPVNAYDRIKELHEYRRQVSEQRKAWQEEQEKTENSKAVENSEKVDEKSENLPEIPKDEKQVEAKSSHETAKSLSKSEINNPNGLPESSKSSTVLEKYLNREAKPKKESRFLNKIRNQNKEESRVDKAIKSLRKNSVGVENEFSESKLLKRAVSLEELSCESPGRKVRSSSLKPEDTEKVFKRRGSAKVKKGGIFESIQGGGSRRVENGLKKKRRGDTDGQGGPAGTDF